MKTTPIAQSRDPVAARAGMPRADILAGEEDRHHAQNHPIVESDIQ